MQKHSCNNSSFTKAGMHTWVRPILHIWKNVASIVKIRDKILTFQMLTEAAENKWSLMINFHWKRKFEFHHTEW